MRATLSIVDRNWTGWSKEQPTPTDFTLVVSAGDQLHDQLPHADFYGIKIVVDAITYEGIVLKTWRLAPEKPSGGIDLMTDFTGLQVRLSKGHGIKLRTQTMDGGKSYSITLVDITE